MEDRVLDRLVTLGFIKKYEYKESEVRNGNDNAWDSKEVLTIYFDKDEKLEIESGSTEDSWLSLF
jgi:hypothetical protein